MKLFVGCYTKKLTEELVGKGAGIYAFEFNAGTGSLRLNSTFPTINPSYLALSSDQKFLYAVEELPLEQRPKIHAFQVDGFKLNHLNSQDLPGSYSCHLALSGDQRHLLVASYMSGCILSYPITKDGGLGPLKHTIRHVGKGPNALRQEAPHLHMIYPIGENRFYAVDLGLDQAKAYEITDVDIYEKSPKDLTIPPGSGARHMIVNPTGSHAFIFSELNAKVFSFRLDHKPILIESMPSLPESYSEMPSGAAIRMHPNGKFIYVSNRGYDHITILEFNSENERMTLIGYEPSGGRTPREINIDPTGKWLLCANQDSDNLTVFSIDEESGLLTLANINEDVNTACCIVFSP